MKRDQLDCASALLDYAKGNGIHVKFIREREKVHHPITCLHDYPYNSQYNLVFWIIENRSADHADHADFILDKLMGKYATLAETVELLELHIGNFVYHFPKLVVSYLKEEKFTIEYARFYAPKALFGLNGKTPIGMSTRQHPEDWSMDNEAAEQLWVQHSTYGERVSEVGCQLTKVVAKFSCVILTEALTNHDREYASCYVVVRN